MALLGWSGVWEVSSGTKRTYDIGTSNWEHRYSPLHVGAYKCSISH